MKKKSEILLSFYEVEKSFSFLGHFTFGEKIDTIS